MLLMEEILHQLRLVVNPMMYRMDVIHPKWCRISSPKCSNVYGFFELHIQVYPQKYLFRDGLRNHSINNGRNASHACKGPHYEIAAAWL